MKRLSITVILCGALLVGVPAAVAEEAPPPPDGLDATLLEDGSLLITWDATNGPIDYRVYRNGEFIASVTNTEFIDPNPLLADAYQIATVAEGIESAPSDPLIVANAGANMETIKFLPTPFLETNIINADTFEGGFPPNCTLLLITVYTSPPFAGAHINQDCLGAWLDP